MVSFLSVSLYGLAAVAGFAGALPGLPKNERRAGSTSDSNVVGYETETQVVTRTIYKSTSGHVSPTSSGASYYTSTVTINGMQYTMCYWSKLAHHHLSSAYQLVFGSWQPVKDNSDFHERGHSYDNGAFVTLYCSLSFHFGPRFDTYCRRKHDDCNLVRSRLYFEKLYAVLQIRSAVLLPEEFHCQFIACRFNSIRFSKHAYGDEDSTAVKLRCSLHQSYSVEWQSSGVLFSEEFHWQFIARCFNPICFSKHAAFSPFSVYCYVQKQFSHYRDRHGQLISLPLVVLERKQFVDADWFND
ncbi:hypothetical protein KC345_g4231 [Hortaea werneckii]|nr:hypothetical protein KC345_g4231 [Hortaea werneckii]